MISIFGIISIVVALLSVAVIILHNRVMAKRTPVDTYLADLENLIRERLNNLYNESHPGTELQALCGQYMDLDLNSMIKALPDIDRACEDEPDINEHEITLSISKTTETLNQAIEAYNSFITGSLPVKLMAFALTLTTEETIHCTLINDTRNRFH